MAKSGGNCMLSAVPKRTTPSVVQVQSPRADVLPTQREVIERAKKLEPNSTPMVERVRKTDVGHPDKWRSP
jgi:hypothetical protein